MTYRFHNSEDLSKENMYSRHPFGVRYLLLNLEQRASQLELLQLNTLASGRFAATVEHVCPQTPRAGSNWETWSADERRQWLHKLGNLAILERAHNTEVLNFGWQDKSSVYRLNRRGQVTPFEYTRRLCENTDWNPTLCQARQKEFENLLFEIYDLNYSDGDGHDNSDGDDSAPDEHTIEEDEDAEMNDQNNPDNEVMDDTVATTDQGNQAEDSELCGKVIIRVPEPYKGLRCGSTRLGLEKYCKRCHSWDVDVGEQCQKERMRNSPFCKNHIRKRVKCPTSNDQPL